MSFNIEVEGGSSVRLPTAGKYCDRDIIIKALGSSGGGANGIYMAKITPAEYVGDLTITHNLGTTDILYIAAWCESFGDNDPPEAGTLCKMWAKTDIVTRRGGNGFSNGYGWSASYNCAEGNNPNAGGYETLEITNDNTVVLPRIQSGTTTGYVAGITYTVFVMAASAFKETEG